MKKHGVEIALIVLILWLLLLVFTWRADASTPKIALVDQTPWHVAMMRRVLGDTPFVHYPQGAAIAIEAASKDGVQIIIVPGWLDNEPPKGDCLPTGYIGGPLNALKMASKTSQVFIGHLDCPEVFGPWATTVGVLDANGNQLTPDGADVYAYGCSLGYCSYSEAIVRAGMGAAE